MRTRLKITLSVCFFFFILLLVSGQQEIKVCSFNVKFIGSYKKKDHRALADLMAPYDIVLIQEMVSPPRDGVFPDGEEYIADEESKEFADEMRVLPKLCQG